MMRKFKLFSFRRKISRLLCCGSSRRRRNSCCFSRRSRSDSSNGRDRIGHNYSNHRHSHWDHHNQNPHRRTRGRRGRKTCRRALAIGTLIFCIYFSLLAFVSFVAISNHRNARLMLNGQKNGSSFGRVYGLIGGNESLNGPGVITIERVGGVNRYRLYTAQLNKTLAADLLRSQTIFKCVPINFRKELKPPVALVSFPGSGNTWLRYLLQLATGIFTGSIYRDFALLRNGFPGESIADGRVLVVKTHETGLTARDPYQKAILLIRKPSEAILAEFNRRAAGHIGQAGRDKYTRNEGRYWSQFVAVKARAWTETNLDWIERFNGPLLITMYTHLVQNTSEELVTILNFLQEDVSDKVMDCVLKNKAGIYQRRKRFSAFNPYSPRMEKFLAAQEKIVVNAIDKRISTRRDQRLNHIHKSKTDMPKS